MVHPIDTDNLDMLKEVIGDDLIEILQVYLDTTPDILSKLEKSIQQQDAAGIQLYAHTLKGSSANIGATELPALSSSLETLAQKGTVTEEQALPLFSRIRQENQKVSQFLHAYIQQF